MNNWTEHRKEILQSNSVINIEEKELSEIFNGKEDDVISIDATTPSTEQRIKQVLLEAEQKLKQWSINLQSFHHIVVHIAYPTSAPLLVNELQEITDWIDNQSNDSAETLWNCSTTNDETFRIIIAGK